MKRLIKRSELEPEFQEALRYALSTTNEDILKVINDNTKDIEESVNEIDDILRKGCEITIKYKDKFSEETMDELKNIINNVNAYLDTIENKDYRKTLEQTMSECDYRLLKI